MLSLGHDVDIVLMNSLQMIKPTQWVYILTARTHWDQGVKETVWSGEKRVLWMDTLGSWGQGHKGYVTKAGMQEAPPVLEQQAAPDQPNMTIRILRKKKIAFSWRNKFLITEN